MDLPADSPTPLSTRGEVVYAGGRLAVLILFTGLFAAVWNTDRTASATVVGVERRPVPRHIGSVANAAVELITHRVASPRRAPMAMLGSRIVAGSPAELPFTGTPALLGGTLRAENVAPLASSQADGRL